MLDFSDLKNYNDIMMAELLQTEVFRKWFGKLRDRRAAIAILSRLDRLSFGHAGDAKPIGDGVCELRIHYSSGYRIYFTRQGDRIIILLCGGDKSSQSRDIELAKKLAQEITSTKRGDL